MIYAIVIEGFFIALGIFLFLYELNKNKAVMKENKELSKDKKDVVRNVQGLAEYEVAAKKITEETKEKVDALQSDNAADILTASNDDWNKRLRDNRKK